MGSRMACAPFVNLVEWNIWKRSKRVCWTKITIIYNLRNLGQKSLKAFKFKSSRRVIIVYLHSHYSCNSTYADNSDSHVTDVVCQIILDKNFIIVPLLWLPWHQFELDVWSWLLASFRVRDRNYRSFRFNLRISHYPRVTCRYRLYYLCHKKSFLCVMFLWVRLLLRFLKLTFFSNCNVIFNN